MPFLGDDTSESLAEVNTHGIFDKFHRLVQDLSDVLGPISGINSDDVNPDDLIRLVESYTSTEEHWLPYAFADSSRSYTRNLVDEGNGKSNLLILVWNPGKGSAIHDHADAHCVMKILKGTLQETIYNMPDVISNEDGTPANDHSHNAAATPIPMRTKLYHRDQVTYISDNIGLHKITNPSTSEVAVSLHLYTPPHAANYGFHMFCEKTGQQTHCKQAGFFSDRGRKVRVALNGPV